MPINLKNSIKKIDDFFAAPPDAEEKAWGIIHDFYNLLLSYMREINLNQSELAKKLGKSRSAISQMFNKNPNVSILKLVEIADAIGIEITISSPQLEMRLGDARETTIDFAQKSSFPIDTQHGLQENVVSMADYLKSINAFSYDAIASIN